MLPIKRITRLIMIFGLLLLLAGGGICAFLLIPSHPSQTSAIATAPTNSGMALDQLSKQLQQVSLYGGKAGKLPLPGVELIKEFEGFYPNAYPDALHGWIIPTIGWGSTEKEDGSKWHRGDKITLEQANELLESQLETDYLPPLSKIPYWDEMGPNRQGALLSFGYNVGAEFYGAPGFNTISKYLEEKQWQHVPAALTLYRNPGSVVEAGLLRRRKAEGKLFSEPV
jgi:lysozyme